MSTRAFRPGVVTAAALVAIASAGPAAAEDPAGPAVADVPPVLASDLSAAEERTLTTLTAGGGVPLSAFVDTPDGPEIVSLDAATRTDAAAAVRLLAAQPSVEAAEIPVRVRVLETWFEQYGNAMVRSTEARPEVDGPLADVVVAVLDTGVAPHPELAGALLPGRNFTASPGGTTDATDRHGHGTHVAGTIAADADSDVEGVAHGARILPVKVLGDGGSGYSSWIADGIVWAADNGADVINMSLGAPSASAVQTAAIDYARSRGVTVIAAAGNDNTSNPSYPAASPGVIGVSAVDQARAKASFSNFGASVDLAAPGVAITSTYPGDAYAGMSGTSMASPHVAGVAALVEATAPGLSPDQVEQALVAGATDLGPAGRDDVFGHGLVDALRAVRAANALEGSGDAPSAQPPAAPTGATAQPLAASVRVAWTASGADGGAPVTGYRIHTYRAGALVKVTTASAAARSVVVGGLVNGVAYRFAVGAVNQTGDGALTAQTAAVAPRTVPGAPKIGTASATRGGAVVRWTAPASNGGAAISGYVVRAYSGGTLIRTVAVAAGARSATVSRLTAGKGYAFRVLAKNAAGLSAASAASKVVKPTR